MARHTIWIRNDVEASFGNEKNKGVLINNLLRRHYEAKRGRTK